MFDVFRGGYTCVIPVIPLNFSVEEKSSCKLFVSKKEIEIQYHKVLVEGVEEITKKM